MRRLQIFILIFCAALIVPVAYFVGHARQSLEQEEKGALRFFADSILNDMEEELARIVSLEEGRAVDEYAAFEGTDTGASPISTVLADSYVIGYFQNNPDGSFSTPHDKNKEAIKLLREANATYNTLRLEKSKKPEPAMLLAKKSVVKSDVLEKRKSLVEPEKKVSSKKEKQSFVDRYLRSSYVRKKSQLGREKSRVEEITMEQAVNVARDDKALAGKGLDFTAPTSGLQRKAMDHDLIAGQKALGDVFGVQKDMETKDRGQTWTHAPAGLFDDALSVSDSAPRPMLENEEQAKQSPPKLRVEVDPLQSMVLDNDRILLFRRIVLNNQVYSQGMVIRAREFLTHLQKTYFSSQPMAGYSSLTLFIMDNGVSKKQVMAGTPGQDLKFRVERTFPRPFSFLKANLSCFDVPRSANRKTLLIMQLTFGFIILAGLLAIYRSAAAVMEYSRRRNQFVSSVTHELKTPLTNIRMYVEMLEMGIAKDTQREQDYLKVLDSESSRLSRLITNVLEFAKLENKKSNPELLHGDLSEVIVELHQILGDRLKSEGFVLEADKKAARDFAYDREAMVQALANLVENSIKFGKQATDKTIFLKISQSVGETRISVSDFGPGIPKNALKRVFDDFFRVENSMTRTTRGTGIGLALVRRFAESMKGRVVAQNNYDGPGCTIKIILPS